MSLATLTRRLRAVKAPPEGHPFYGNQWTDEAGSGEGEGGGEGKGRDAETVAVLRERTEQALAFDKYAYKKADTWATAIYGDVAGDIGEAAQDTIVLYTGSGYATTNEYLREGSFSRNYDAQRQADTLHRIEVMDQVIDNAPRIPEDVILSRVGTARYADMQPGQEFVDHAYVSTTLVEDVANRRRADFPYDQDTAIYTILAPAGSKALYTGAGLSINSSEIEMLLPRNSRFVITRPAERTGKHQWRIYAAYVGQAEEGK